MIRLCQSGRNKQKLGQWQHGRERVDIQQLQSVAFRDDLSDHSATLALKALTHA